MMIDQNGDVSIGTVSSFARLGVVAPSNAVVGESDFGEFLKHAFFRNHQLLGGSLDCFLFNLCDAFYDPAGVAETCGICGMRIEACKRIGFTDLPGFCHLLGEDFVLNILKWWHERYGAELVPQVVAWPRPEGTHVRGRKED